MYVVHCHIVTYIVYEPHVTLLGDHHNIYAQVADKEHLVILLKQLSEKKQKCILLVEDPFYQIHRCLKRVDPCYNKYTFLPGLIQRINELYNPHISTLCIERAGILARALFFFYQAPICPLFEDLSPQKIDLLNIQNAYSLTYAMLIDEIRFHQKELLARHEQFQPQDNCHVFIDSMNRQIDRQIDLLNKLMHSNSILSSESMLKTVIQLWLYKKQVQQPDQKEKYCTLGLMLQKFIQNYQDGMCKESWKQQAVAIKKRCLEVERLHWEEVLESNYCCNSSRYCTQKDKQNEPVQPTCGITVQVSDAIKGFYKILLNLRLLLVDSHATLDIVRNKQFDIVVIAGNLHIENISKYLAKLGFEKLKSIIQGSDASTDCLDDTKIII